jgi:hypothetical protein
MFLRRVTSELATLQSRPIMASCMNVVLHTDTLDHSTFARPRSTRRKADGYPRSLVGQT